MLNVKFIEVHDYTHLKIDTVSKLVHEIQHILKLKDNVTIAIPGGRSVKALFEGLKETRSLERDEWNKMHFFWADERLVPPDDKESNYRLAKELFLDDLIERGYLMKSHIHRFNGESEDPKKEVKNYSAELSKISEHIDIAILGVGEDGHIASIFPNHNSIKNKEEGFMFVTNSPKPPKDRISITPKEIISAKSIFLFFLGEGKVEAHNNFLDENIKIEDCPAKLVLNNQKAKIYIISGLP